MGPTLSSVCSGLDAVDASAAWHVSFAHGFVKHTGMCATSYKTRTPRATPDSSTGRPRVAHPRQRP